MGGLIGILVGGFSVFMIAPSIASMASAQVSAAAQRRQFEAQQALKSNKQS